MEIDQVIRLWLNKRCWRLLTGTSDCLFRTCTGTVGLKSKHPRYECVVTAGRPLDSRNSRVAWEASVSEETLC